MVELRRISEPAVSPAPAPAPIRTHDQRSSVHLVPSIYRDLRDAAQLAWWNQASPSLSRWYTDRGGEYKVRPLPELGLRRPVLHRWLAMRSSYGDFDWYHRRFQHDDAKLDCPCGNKKTPEHIALCPRAQVTIRHWPRGPRALSSRHEAIEYLRLLEPGEFA
ncbi:hypothetical protein N7486_005918 [Penicillium sp. IBT 16267x]|nr:hypothetical protein N7486_005918 [Penicillium sp. IBT 16267x]